MFKLLKFVKPLAHVMFMTIVLGTLGYLATSGITLLGAYVLITRAIFSMPWILFLLVLGAAFFKYFEQLSGHYIAFKLLAHMRDKIFSKLRTLAPAKLETEEKGNLIALITTDIELIEVFYAHTIAPVCIALTTSVIMMLFFGFFHWSLALLALVGYVMVGLLIPIWNHRRGQASGQNYRHLFGHLNNAILENVRGIKEIQQFAYGDQRRKDLYALSSKLSAENQVLKKHEGMAKALTEGVILTLSLSALALSLWLASQGHITSNAPWMVTMAMLGSFGPTVALSALSNDLTQTLASGERLLNLLSERPVVEENQEGDALDLENLKTLSAENISFAYKEKPILKDLNVHFSVGQIIGIKGQSGSGKSTLLKLIMRFWDSDKGKIFYKDKESHCVKDIDTSHLRMATSYVTQETYLFNDTLRANIAIGKLDASDEAIIKAAKKASIHDFIMGLPNGYDSHVGEMGQFLSGGERQRIGIARAFLSDAPFMLLDEPTSNLDSLNEAIILRAIETYSQDKCVILVSHRASTLNFCDQIHHMHQGQLERSLS